MEKENIKLSKNNFESFFKNKTIKDIKIIESVCKSIIEIEIIFTDGIGIILKSECEDPYCFSCIKIWKK